MVNGKRGKRGDDDAVARQTNSAQLQTPTSASPASLSTLSSSSETLPRSIFEQTLAVDVWVDQDQRRPCRMKSGSDMRVRVRFVTRM